jgi:hypothetical protein
MTKPWSRALREKAKHSGAAETIGTIAFYGPDRSYASKVAVEACLRQRRSSGYPRTLV